MSLKTILIPSVIIVLFSCGNNTTKIPAGIASQKEAAQQSSIGISASEIKPNDLVSKEDYEKGKELVAKSDCIGCHKPAEKLIGPSYIDIANKYTFNKDYTDTLIKKIITGGAGLWGDVPMQPHNGLSATDARGMVMYIYSFKRTDP
ncbi:MAG: c-type cytochrome [Bacteroidetes bacterium]|nr:c-type cytochrome [Bacteroidota bacterium]